MSDLNKQILQKANAAISAGDTEGFLAFCSDDIVWSVVGGATLRGKDAVRAEMARERTGPSGFTVDTLIAQGEYVVALGDVTSAGDDGKPVVSAYSDIWRFRDGKMVELRAFIIPSAQQKN